MISARLFINGFSASNGYVRGFLKRYDIFNVAMHGQDGAANLVAAAAAVEDIRRMLEAYPPDRMYNMEETRLLYRCLPSRSYVPRRDRRHARGTKAMRNMERVTLVLCTNATGTHKLPVAMIGQAENPMCFRGEGNACSLPYFNQKREWMDKHVYERWWNTVFLSAVHQRHKGAKSSQIMDNASTHDVNLSAEDVEVNFRPPSSTALDQPMDAGVIASLMRRYKRRLLAILVRSLCVPLVSPPPCPQPNPLRTPSPEPPPLLPQTPPPLPPPATSPMAPHGFRERNDELWMVPAVSVSQVYGAPRSEALEAPDDAADAAAQQGLPAALLPPP